MTQVVIISIVFSNWGLGWTGLRKEFAPAVGLLLFATLAVFSRIWLMWFRLGPAEWILRSATYARLQPLRRGRPETVSGGLTNDWSRGADRLV